MKFSNWNISFILLCLYLGTFHLWVYLNPAAIILSSALVGLIWLSVTFNNRQYFINRYDLFFHSVPCVNILTEAFLPQHAGYNFYYCGIAFFTVITLYRALAKAD